MTDLFDHQDAPALPATREIPLSNGSVALVDADDYERLAAHKWSATVSGGKTYAHRRRKQSESGKYGGLVVMHRIIMGVQDGPAKVYVDHINGNTLDNRKTNLRLCRPGENSKNLSKVRTQTGMRGVTRTRGGKWRVRIRRDLELIEVGTFDTERDASIAYGFASRTLHGEFGSTPGHERHSDGVAV